MQRIDLRGQEETDQLKAFTVTNERPWPWKWREADR